MHVGGLTLLEGPPPTLEEFLDQIRQRLHLVPRYRHKLAHTHTALDSGRPVWVDDPSFNLKYHVRHTALPAPGDWEQLCGLTARIFSQQLDRSEPLWEMWLIEGLQDDRFALISKTHHSLIDGIAGIDLATVLFDLSPDPPPVRHSGRVAAAPGARHAGAAGRGARGAARRGRARRRRRRRAGAPRPRARHGARGGGGTGRVVWAVLNPAPATPLNVDIGPHRRFVGVGCRLEDFKLVKNAFGCTVNDVVLAVVAGALRGFMVAAACAPRALSCGHWCRCRCAPRTSTTSSGTASSRCAGRCPSTSPTQSSGWCSSNAKWTASRTQSRRSAPR